MAHFKRNGSHKTSSALKWKPSAPPYLLNSNQITDFAAELRKKQIYMQNMQEGSSICENILKYEKIAKIGQGTFGVVFKGRLIRPPADGENKFVAMKRIITENENEGFPITALREIKILQRIKHRNVVEFIEVCKTSPCKNNNYQSNFYIVFEFCEHDLARLLANSNVKFHLGEIKSIIKQLLNALFYIHSNNLLHRDLKAANILITKDGVLKLADFGLARAISKDVNKRYTNRVVTLWYRPPELILGAREYGPPIDLWGVGCVMAELWTRSAILQGNTEQKQLDLITNLCGTISPETWPGVENLELFRQMYLKPQRRKVKDRLRPYVQDENALDLLDQFLILDPSKRINADVALNHSFLWTDPMPCGLKGMLTTYSQSMYAGSSKKAYAAKQQNLAKPNGSSNDDNEYSERVF